MNVENIKKLADHIRNIPYGNTKGTFNMEETHHYSDYQPEKDKSPAPACIGGYGRQLFKSNGIFPMGEEFLGLSEKQIHDLMFIPPKGWADRKRNPSGTDAAKVLDHLAETGEVDWSIVDLSKAA